MLLLECWRGALGVLLECCSCHGAGGLLLQGFWRGFLEGVFLLRGLRFPDEGREWNKAMARVYVPKGIRLLKGTGAGAEPGLKKWTMCWIA